MSWISWPKNCFFFFFCLLDPKFIPGNPGWFTYRHFASGNFHCFAGLVNPYWGLPEPPPATHPGIHTGARFRTTPPPFGPSSTSTPATPNNLHPRALLYHPTNRPLFPGPPPEREKPAASRPGSGLFPPLPVTSPAPPDWPMLRQWRHTGLAHWPTRFIDISTVHPLSSPQKWVTRTGVARTRFVLSQILTLSLFFFPSPLFLPFSLSPLFSRTLCILLPYSLSSSITLYVEAWRFRRVSSEISTAMFSYQLEYARKKLHVSRK